MLLLIMLYVMQPIHSFLPETVTQRCSVKKVFLEISQNSQESTFARVPKLQALGCFCSADFVTVTEEILNEKLHFFLSSVSLA